ncbi:MAG: hypothetical protein UH854_06605, partial [Clostridia bacterium]|nr:hypothetical protein [Clostridia bacterium]
MALKIIYGVSSTGKTHTCFDYINNHLDTTDKNVIYVVPEQYSLQAERSISAEFSKKALDRVEVLSLERLAKRTFSIVGPVLCDFLDDNAKLMIVEKAIIKVSGKLTYFNKSADVSGFSLVVLDIIKKLKSNCVTLDVLKSIAESTDNIIFKFKIFDLILIYSEYEKFFDFPYVDSDDNMLLLAEKIERFGLYKNTCFVFDNFVSFSKQQLLVVESIMKNSSDVVVALTADSLEYKNKFELFYNAKLTAEILFGLAYKNNIEVLPNTYLEKSFNENTELSFLKNNYFADKKAFYNKKTDSLFICKSDNYNNEADQVAKEIVRLVREEAYRYKDIAVITRNADVYYPIIRDVFDRYGIFYNITETKKSNDNFIHSALMSVFNIVINNYSFDSVFTFVRSCLCGLSDDDKFLLENYVLEAGNREQLWTQDKELTFKGSFTDFELQRINDSINYVRNAISSFTNKFKGRKTVDEIAEAFFAFLDYVKAESKIKNVV